MRLFELHTCKYRCVFLISKLQFSCTEYFDNLCYTERWPDHPPFLQNKLGQAHLSYAKWSDLPLRIFSQFGQELMDHIPSYQVTQIPSHQINLIPSHKADQILPDTDF